MRYQKRGFTLTELLIVVMVIGILGMAIVPKFNKMFLTRQMTEAEDMLSAIRQEQVLRCMEDNGYTSNVWDLSALDSLPKSDRYAMSKYFKYEVGTKKYDAMATSLSGDNLALAIPSFEDGRICCTGDCSGLSKDYEDCDDLVDILEDEKTAAVQDDRCWE